MFSGMRRADFITPAAAVVQSTNDAFAAARNNATDFTRIAKANINALNTVDLASMKAQNNFQLTKNEVDHLRKIDKIQNDGLEEANKILKPARRMAGLTALLGTLSTGYYLNEENKREREEQELEKQERQKTLDAYEKMFQQERSAYTELEDSVKDLQKKLLQQSNGTGQQINQGGLNTNTSEVSGKDSGKSLATNLSGNRKILADAIALYESGEHGYDAVNQGGTDGGTKIPQGWYSGSFSKMSQHGGRKLTDLSLKEIFDLQYDPGRKALSDADWVKRGKLHAVGRYQFIGSTLKDEVTKMGLDLNTKFTPDVQDQIFFSHAKRIGNISPWVGPSKNYGQDKRNYLNSLIPTI